MILVSGLLKCEILYKPQTTVVLKHLSVDVLKQKKQILQALL